MANKPFIGINTDYFSPVDARPAYSVTCAGYFDCVSAAGGIPVLIPPLADENDLDAVLERLDGILLIGGRDFRPSKRRLYASPNGETDG